MRVFVCAWVCVCMLVFAVHRGQSRPFDTVNKVHAEILKLRVYIATVSFSLKTVNTTGPEGIRPHNEVTDRWLSH